MRSFLFQICAVVGLMVLTVGCAKRTPAPRWPSPQLEQTHFLGSAVSGAQTGMLPADVSANEIVASIQIVALLSGSSHQLSSIGSDARLVVSAEDRQPILPTGQLTGKIQWATSEAGDEFA